MHHSCHLLRAALAGRECSSMRTHGLFPTTASKTTALHYRVETLFHYTPRHSKPFTSKPTISTCKPTIASHLQEAHELVIVVPDLYVLRNVRAGHAPTPDNDLQGHVQHFLGQVLDSSGERCREQRLLNITHKTKDRGENNANTGAGVKLQ